MDAASDLSLVLSGRRFLVGIYSEATHGLAMYSETARTTKV